MMPLMQPRILLISTYYPEFLDRFYAGQPEFAELDFEAQMQRIYATGFALGDAYPFYLGALGCEARQVVVNADVTQARWAAEHDVALSGNVHERRRQVVAAQIDHYQPEVLYVFEWCPLGDAFLAEMASRVRLIAGQIASPLRPERTYTPYQLMVSSCPPLVAHFRGTGARALYLKLGFDPRVLEHLEPGPTEYDVTFVGGFAPSHPTRAEWLERLLESVHVDIFGYGLERIAPDSPIRTHHHGPVWGWEMYQVLQRSRITLNLHAENDIRGTVDTTQANNMRLFEATGVGTCLVTDAKDNLADFFEPGREIVTFRHPAECVEQVQHYLTHEPQRAAIAQAGQQRTLKDHTYAHRMGELLGELKTHL